MQLRVIPTNLTDYELSLESVTPVRAHLALDAVGGAALALAPVRTTPARTGSVVRLTRRLKRAAKG